MRHSKRKHKLGVSSPHRSAMMGNLAVALISHGRIETTLPKAKALRPFIEKIITLAKKAEAANDAARKLHFRRLAVARVRDKKAVAKLFDERVSEFVDRSGGYTRIYKIGQRIGDAAEMALIELIDGNDEGYASPKKRTAKKGAKKAAKKPAAAEETDGGEQAAEEKEAQSETAAKAAAAAAEAPAAEPAEDGEPEEKNEEPQETSETPEETPEGPEEENKKDS